MTSSPWMLLLLASVAVIGAFWLGRRSNARNSPTPLPGDWAVMARPVLNADERRTMRMLRDAMPQYVVLAKLPLVRLCQPRDPQKVRYWFDLLGPLHVSFAVCSPNGRVLAVIDLEPERGFSRRAARIKQSVLDACRIRYLACRAENLPPAGELQLLLRPQGVVSSPVPLAPTPTFVAARSTLSDTVRTKRAERSARWADSNFPQDSFFAPDSRLDGGPTSEFSPLSMAREDLPSALR